MRGIASMLVAVAFFAAMDAVLKVLAGSYPAFQVGALRGAASLPFVIASVAATNQWQDLRIVRWDLHLLRGVLALVMMWGLLLPSAYCRWLIPMQSFLLHLCW
ncbi:MAG: hypothetical protein R3F24_05980 [Gammaproteobacteria bacterium]